MSNDIINNAVKLASQMKIAGAEVAPYFRIPTPPLSTTNPAAWMHERLGNYIREFEINLDQDHEIGVRLVCFGQAVTIHVQSVGYHGPDIITFFGMNSEGEKMQLIQHITQLSFLLIAVKKIADEPRRIGFLWDKEEKPAASE